MSEYVFTVPQDQPPTNGAVALPRGNETFNAPLDFPYGGSPAPDVPPTPPTPTYTAEAVALFAAMLVQPDVVRKVVIDNTIRILKGENIDGKNPSLLNILPKEKEFMMYAAHTEQAGLLNWVNPAQSGINVSSTPHFANNGFVQNTNGQSVQSAANINAISGVANTNFSAWRFTNGTVSTSGPGKFVLTTAEAYARFLLRYSYGAGLFANFWSVASVSLSPFFTNSAGLHIMARSGSNGYNSFNGGAYNIKTSLYTLTALPANKMVFIRSSSDISNASGLLRTTGAGISEFLTEDEKTVHANACNYYMTAIGLGY